MTLPQILALSLGLSVAVAAIGGPAALLLQKVSPDPRLRERAWSLALWAPALAPVATALLLLGPAPVLEVASAPIATLAADAVAPAVVATTPLAEPAFVMDWNLAALVLLGLAAALTAARLIALGVRTARLNGLMREAEAAPLSLVEAIHAVADDFWVRAPGVRVSPLTSEALLAGLIRPVLILPRAFAGEEEAPDARAVFAHELAHLKRRDHHALWLEEALLAALAINPLLPLLRRARAAAREEACDALALAGAAPEVRRAYARTLIEALKHRADLPEHALAPAPIPALTFTGTPRSLAMSRLKAVLDPAPAAGRRARLSVLGVAALILGLAGGGAFAVAGQRSPQLVASVASAVLPPEATAFEVNLTWRGVTPQAGDRLVVSLERKVGETTFRRSLDFGLAQGAALPASVKAMVQPEFFQGYHAPMMKTALVARDGKVRATSGDRVMPMLISNARAIGYAVLTATTDAPQAAAEDSVDATVRAAWEALTPDQRVRYANPTGEQYKTLCGADADEPFCVGVLFGMLPSAEIGADTRGVCPPRDASGDWDNHAVSEQGRRAVRGLTVQPGQTMPQVAGAALRTAFPCPTAVSGAPVRVRLERGGDAVAVGPGERIVVQLTGENGETVSTAVADRASLHDGAVGMSLGDRHFPGFGQATRVYILTGLLYGADGAVVSRAEPVTIRLAAMSRLAANLRPTLTFPT
jgi:beta-lactamase regulating signal transducer with metallopeptidase domain